MKQGLFAILLLVAACATPQERVRTSLESAVELKGKNELAKAAAEYEKVLELEPANLVALRGLVEVHQKLGRLGELERRFSRAIEKNGDDAFAHEGLGLTLFAKAGTDGERARTELEKAVQLAPEVADFHYRLGVLLVESDRFADAKAPLAKAIALDPRRARYRLPYALVLGKTGDRPGAVAQLAKVLELGPTQDEMRVGDRTARALVDPFRGFPQAAREQYELALSWLQGDSLVQAQQVLDSLTEKFPDLAIVHATSGLLAVKMDDGGRAISEFRRAIELEPDLAEARMYLGDIYLSRGRPDAAREHFEAALARNPFLADAHRRLAEVHLKAGEKDAAANRFATYLLLRPDDFDAQAARATLLTELGRPEAGAAWDEIARLFPRRPEALISRGKYFYTRGLVTKGDERAEAKAKAIASLEAAVEVDQENATATALLVEARKL